MFFFHFITYHLYLLQLENYELVRYWRLISKKGLFHPKEPLRKKLVWTAKAKFLFAGATLLHFFLTLYLVYTVLFFAAPYPPPLGVMWFVARLLFLMLLYPLFYTLVLALLIPFDHITKSFIIARARKRIASLKHLTIVGIAGSYGKTTMKEVIATMLGQKFTVVKTPDSVNTPLGVARLVLKKITAQTNIFIVEMGEHYKGDIAYLCSIAPPSISVITGINEAHLERLKNMENAIATIFEIAENTKRDGIIVLNADDKLIQNHYKNYTNGRETFFYSSSYFPLSPYRGENVLFNENGSGVTFTLFEGERPLEKFTVPFLGKYIIGDISAAWTIGIRLGMSNDELANGVKELQPIPHRLQLIKGERGILVIDDSYNGNPAGAREAINALAQFSGRRKVYITPGLVEMGEKTRQAHREIGKELSKVADLVILIQTSAAPFIAEGLVENGFPKENVRWYKTAPEAHEALSSLLRANDVVLFQNDWGDNYV